jgi:hypothetical protein
LTASRGLSRGRLGLWALAVVSTFLVLTFSVWFFATSVETSTTIVDPKDGTVIARESDTDLAQLAVPGTFLGGSLICLSASIIALRRAGRN